MTDWNKIKIEYVTTDITIRSLAEKYNVHYSTIGQRASKEKWKEQRKQNINKTQTKTLDIVASKKAKIQAKKILAIEDVASELLQKTIQATSEVNLYPVNNEDGKTTFEQGLIRVANVKTLSDVLINLDKLRKEGSEDKEKVEEILIKIKQVADDDRN